MEQIKFIKNHPSNRFKKGDLIDMPKENVAAWIRSGYAVLPREIGENEGNVTTSMKVGGESKENLLSGGDVQSKSGKKNKKKNRKNK